MMGLPSLANEENHLMSQVILIVAGIFAVAWVLADKKAVKEMQPGIARWARPLAFIGWGIFLLMIFS